MNDDFEIPPNATVYRCEHCGRPFVRERHLALHRGLDHSDLSEEELADFESAREAERDAIRRFRIVALGALVAVYFGFLFAYAIFA